MKIAGHVSRTAVGPELAMIHGDCSTDPYRHLARLQIRGLTNSPDSQSAPAPLQHALFQK